jgi:hypothetical protein
MENPGLAWRSEQCYGYSPGTTELSCSEFEADFDRIPGCGVVLPAVGDGRRVLLRLGDVLV